MNNDLKNLNCLYFFLYLISFGKWNFSDYSYFSYKYIFFFEVPFVIVVDSDDIIEFNRLLVSKSFLF